MSLSITRHHFHRQLIILDTLSRIYLPTLFTASGKSQRLYKATCLGTRTPDRHSTINSAAIRLLQVMGGVWHHLLQSGKWLPNSLSNLRYAIGLPRPPRREVDRSWQL